MPVLTAPLAIIKFNNIAIGKIRTISVDENINRQVVRGIGSLEGTEAPALTYEGTVNCDYYLIEYRKVLNKLQESNVLLTAVDSVEEFVNTVLLNENGVQVDIYRKANDGLNANGSIRAKNVLVATLTEVYLTRRSMNIAEGQISGSNASFIFLSPIIYPGG